MTYQVCDTRGAVLAKAGSLEEVKELALSFKPPVLVKPGSLKEAKALAAMCGLPVLIKYAKQIGCAVWRRE